LWAGTEAGLVHIDNGRIHRFTTRDGIPDNAVSSLAEGPRGEIWAGTADGISRYNGSEFSTYRIRDGLSHSLVLSLAFDREGTLWAGTKSGLDQFSDSKLTPFTTNEGLSSNEASALVSDRDGRLWIGTLDRGLNVFDGRRFRSITHKDGLSDDRVLSLAVDNAGDVWAGTEHGISRLKSGAVVKTYRLSGQEVLALFVDSAGGLWARTNRGINKFDGSEFRTVNVSAGAKGVVALSGGGSVRLFVSGADSQLANLQNDGFTTFALPAGTRPVVSYFIDQTRHTAWMGTLGSALFGWHNGRICRVRVRDGLYDNRIYSILKDDSENLWMASSKGIFRVGENELDDFVDGKRKAVTSIPFSTGQLRFECRSGVQPAACKTRDGRLWFSTTTGLVVVNPNHLHSNPVPPPVQITALIVDGKRIDMNRSIEVQPREKNLEIRYAGLSFVSPDKVSFQYMLDGFETSWTDAGSRREAFFTNLPPGNFHFKVRARNADGVWSTEAASIEFAVEPRFYQRWWFFVVAGLMLAAMVGAGYRFRMERLRRQFALVTAERTRIARELHDTLLQGLSGITMQLHALSLGLPPGSKERRILGEIVQDASQYSAEARQSLWGLRRAEADAPLFSDRLAELARSATVHSAVSLSLNIQPLSLGQQPTAEFQLLRIAREAISNALQHAEASTLRVGLSLCDHELHMTLEDDGKGFAREEQYQTAGHFGLVGMKERAEEIGAVLEVLSSSSGSTILVRLRLSRNVELVQRRQTG
jgi:signal transduction histidine kinase/ligand-binding sensor domain-containing protein